MKHPVPANFEHTLCQEYDDYRISNYYDTLYWLGQERANELLIASCTNCEESIKDCKVYGSGLDYDCAQFLCKDCEEEKQKKIASRKLVK